MSEWIDSCHDYQSHKITIFIIKIANLNWTIIMFKQSTKFPTYIVSDNLHNNPVTKTLFFIHNKRMEQKI